MKKIYLLSIILVPLLLTNSVNAHDKSHNDTSNSPMFSGLDSDAGIIAKQFHKALSEANAETVMSLLADDVLILEGGRIERSADEYRAHHLQADMQFSSAVSTKTIEHHVRVHGNTAVSISRSHTSGNYKGRDIDRTGNETLFLTLINGQWKISHIHWSH